MKKLLKLADNYVKGCTWKELALIKFCICSMGVLIGLLICDKHKKAAGITAGGVFFATYIPLMAGFIKSISLSSKAEK